MLTPEDKKEIEKMVSLASRKGYNKRVGDTPNDALQLTPKKYVGQAFTTETRPASIRGVLSVQFFNLTDGMPWYYNPSASVWGDAAGSVVASN